MNLLKVLKKVLNSLKLKHFRKHLCQFKKKQFHKRIINLIHEISYSWLLNAIKKNKNPWINFNFFEFIFEKSLRPCFYLLHLNFKFGIPKWSSSIPIFVPLGISNKVDIHANNSF
jgi:hypothetical protein